MPDDKPEPNVIYAMALPIDFLARINQLALERRCLASDVLVGFAVQGERCSRNHEKVK